MWLTGTLISSGWGSLGFEAGGFPSWRYQGLNLKPSTSKAGALQPTCNLSPYVAIPHPTTTQVMGLPCICYTKGGQTSDLINLLFFLSFSFFVIVTMWSMSQVQTNGWCGRCQFLGRVNWPGAPHQLWPLVMPRGIAWVAGTQGRAAVTHTHTHTLWTGQQVSNQGSLSMQTWEWR